MKQKMKQKQGGMQKPQNRDEGIKIKHNKAELLEECWSRF